MIGLKRVLVTTDFSETSAAALAYGLEFAGRFGASLHVLHVVTEPLHDNWACYVPGASLVAVIERFKVDAQEHLARLVPAEDVATGRVVLATTFGFPTDQILEYAHDHDVDLIVCGTHGRRGWDHVAMGSVAEHVVRRASCPVLTVHYPEREFILPDRILDRSAATS